MKKLLILLAAALFVNVNADAEKRNKSEILSAAANVLSTNRQVTSNGKSAGSILILNDSYSQLSIVGYENGSYAIVANDDQFPAIIGYSDSDAVYDENSMAPAFKWLLEVNNKYMEETIKNGAVPRTYKLNPEYKTEVPAMMTTQWSQGAPYSDLTPQYGSGQFAPHYVTGCVATAMAQVINYFQYPERGRGVIRYSFPVEDGKSKKVSVNFEEEAIDYANMLDRYEGVRYNDDQAYAVAYLMKCAGASVRMRYSPNGSAAYTKDAALGMYTYFNYDLSTECYHKDWMHEDEWNDLAYKSLNDGCPLLFGAESSIGGQDAGHSFVVDGYDSKGLVHVNFGWEGDSDGYYSLFNMHGYDHGFEMVITKKPVENSHLKSYWSIFKGDFKYASNTGKVTASIINSSAFDFSGSVGVILQNMDDGSQIVLGEESYMDQSMDKDMIYYNVIDYERKITFPSDLKDGKYRLFLASRGSWEIKYDPTDRRSETYIYNETEWQPVRAHEDSKNSYIIAVKDGEISSSSEKNSGWVTAIEDITVNNNEKSDKVEVFDIQGRKLYTSSVSEFNISDVPATGMLIIKNGSDVRKVLKK